MQPDIRLFDRAVARLTRRQLLDVAWKLGAAAVLQPLAGSRLLAQPKFRSDPFTLGVASGDPGPAGVVLWTRLAPEPLDGGGMPTANVEVGYELARDDGFRDIVRTGRAVARPELGHAVHVEADGLEPGRDYWYRFHAGDSVSPAGRTKTAPAAGAAVDTLRFGVCGCSHYEAGYFTAFQRMADEHFDFVFHTGDYIYEGPETAGRVRQHRGRELYTLVDYRNRYALYKADADLRAVHASAPFVVTWDDHEVDNDYADSIDEHDTPPELFLLRRAAAYQAYFEHMPLRRSCLPSGPRMQLYRSLAFGRLVDLSVLDTRQYRSDQACGSGAATNCAAAGDPARSILGSTQEKWLFDRLANARARWTVIGQQVPMFAMDRGPAADPRMRFPMDKWDGYTASRQRVFARLKQTRAANPIVLSGDVHVHYGSDLKMDFRNPQSDIVGVEFTNTSITSGGDGRAVSATWDTFRTHNPHLRFHSAKRGYIACTTTPETMRAEFKVLERVTVREQGPMRVAGSLVVEAGRPGSTLD